MSAEGVQTLRWLGAEAPQLDAPALQSAGPIVLGCYGGHSGAGASRNEDAALVWANDAAGWRFAMLLDAHGSADSAALLLDSIASERASIEQLLAAPVGRAFPALEQHLRSLWLAPAFQRQCAAVRGETACLLVAQKERFLFWLCVGDCLVYLLHPELARLGQYALNQRSFYEWLGRASSFALEVPCYASGVRELRGGRSRIVLASDGLLECGARPFEQPGQLYAALYDGPLQVAVSAALQRVHAEQGRDSATLIAWDYASPLPGLAPSV